jgi:hypothetical protein
VELVGMKEGTLVAIYGLLEGISLGGAVVLLGDSDALLEGISLGGAIVLGPPLGLAGGDELGLVDSVGLSDGSLLG